MLPSWQSWASSFQVGSLPSPVGSTVAGGMLAFGEVSVLVEVSSVLVSDDEEVSSDDEDDELLEVEVAEVVLLAVAFLSSLLPRNRISPTATAATTTTPATT